MMLHPRQLKPRQREILEEVVSQIESVLSDGVDADVSFRFEHALTPDLRDRIVELEREIYGEEEAYRPEEVEAFFEGDDTLLVTLRIDGAIQGFGFGYREDGTAPMVEGADYFLDDIIVAPQYEQKGIGTLSSLLPFLMLYFLDYHDIGITTEEEDEDGRPLGEWYRQMGFREAVSHRCDDYVLLLELEAPWLEAFAERVGVELPSLQGGAS
jgi:GNAT superfamily N-acetyltransferase